MKTMDKKKRKLSAKKIIGGVAADNRQHVKKLEKKAIKFMQTIASAYQPLYLAYSGGKDSEVVLHLAQKAGIKFIPFYNNTTIDPPGTLSRIKSKGVLIIQPKRRFFELIEHRGLPSTWQRFCCDELKKRFVAEYVMTGVRKAESQRRNQRYQEPEICYLYKTGQKGKRIMPILYWKTSDIETYIEMEHIKLHPRYYDTNGKLDVKVRLGCMACPLRQDRGIPDFKKYPKLVRAWCRALAVYRNTRPTVTKSIAHFRDEYENFYHNLYHHSLKELENKRQQENGFDPRQELMKIFATELPEPQSKLSDIKHRLESGKPSQ